MSYTIDNSNSAETTKARNSINIEISAQRTEFLSKQHFNMSGRSHY